MRVLDEVAQIFWRKILLCTLLSAAGGICERGK
jgi:hypothetical protein